MDTLSSFECVYCKRNLKILPLYWIEENHPDLCYCSKICQQNYYRHDDDSCRSTDELSIDAVQFSKKTLHIQNYLMTHRILGFFLVILPERQHIKHFNDIVDSIAASFLLWQTNLQKVANLPKVLSEMKVFVKNEVYMRRIEVSFEREGKRLHLLGEGRRDVWQKFLKGFIFFKMEAIQKKLQNLAKEPLTASQASNRLQKWIQNLNLFKQQTITNLLRGFWKRSNTGEPQKDVYDILKFIPPTSFVGEIIDTEKYKRTIDRFQKMIAKDMDDLYSWWKRNERFLVPLHNRLLGWVPGPAVDLGLSEDPKLKSLLSMQPADYVRALLKTERKVVRIKPKPHAQLLMEIENAEFEVPGVIVNVEMKYGVNFTQKASLSLIGMLIKERIPRTTVEDFHSAIRIIIWKVPNRMGNTLPQDLKVTLPVSRVDQEKGRRYPIRLNIAMHGMSEYANDILRPLSLFKKSWPPLQTTLYDTWFEIPTTSRNKPIERVVVAPSFGSAEKQKDLIFLTFRKEEVTKLLGGKVKIVERTNLAFEEIFILSFHEEETLDV